MVGSLSSFLTIWSFPFHSLCLRGSSSGRPKNAKNKAARCVFLCQFWCHLCSFVLLWHLIKINCHGFYEHEHATSFKCASFCINQHSEVIPLCPQLFFYYIHLIMYDPLLCTCDRGCLWIISPSCLLATMHLRRKAVEGSVCVEDAVIESHQ